jgi:Big-like domain-containing protein/hemolysin type calcium-binding protein/putative glycosyl hydrolase
MQGPRATLLAVILAGLAMSLVAASPAAGARSEFFGISQGVSRLDEQDFQRMQTTRVRTERFPIQWAKVERSQGSLDWGNTDAFVGALASHGIRPVPFVWGSPSWVSGTVGRPPLDNAAEEQAWKDFLRAAVARYEPGGSYWGAPYHNRFGAGATAYPIKAWQAWNEPNGRQKFWAPSPSPPQYARLLELSHNAIKSQDPGAQVVLAGLGGYADTRSWDFLDDLYGVAGVKGDFDVAALHPYGSSLGKTRDVIERVRGVMTQHGDGGTPLWFTEFAWGSAPPDQFGINKGLEGQERLLRDSYKMILNNRNAWNVQRLIWFFWRDPAPGDETAPCSFCRSAGLLRSDRTPKPAFDIFKGFAAETNPPQASITSGPSNGSFTNDPTPTFRFSSNEAGSTFQCRTGATSFKTCSSPYTVAQLSDGTRTILVKAIDAAGNESQVKSRSFTVDTVAPAVTVTSGPADGSTSSNRNPSFSFDSNESSASLTCQLDSGGFAPCSSPYAASQLDNGQHSFQVRATDKAGNVGSAARTWRIGLVITSGPASPTNDPTPTFAFTSPDSSTSTSCRVDDAVVDPDCDSPFTSSTLSDGDHTFTVEQGTDTVSREFTVDTARPSATIISGPAGATNDPTPTFRFSSSEPGSTFRCRYDGHGFAACSGAKSDTPTSPLSDGSHTFHVKAIDAADNESQALSRTLDVDTVAPRVTIRRPGKTKAKGRNRARVTFLLKASEQVNRRCRIDSRRFKACSWRFRTPRLSHGIHRLKVKATDRAGNVGNKRKRFRIARKRVRRSTPEAHSHVWCHEAAATLVGSRRSDRLTGTSGRDVIVGFGGDDKIKGRGGPDVICARSGDDDVAAGSGADWVRGGHGSDDLRGGPGRDTIRGGSGFDSCGSNPRDRTFHCQAP